MPRDLGLIEPERAVKIADADLLLGDRHVFDCFERIRDTAVQMREALTRGDWDEVGRQIARSRLLNIDDALEAFRAAGAYLPQTFQHVSDVRASLVEIERVGPLTHPPGRLHTGGEAVDGQRAQHIP